MSSVRLIEKQWLRNFKKSALVDPESGRYRSGLARQLYYAKQDEDYPADLPSDFEKVFHDYTGWHQEQVITSCLEFLGAVGIRIKPQRVYEHLARFPDDLSKLVTKTHYILKTLADRGSDVDVELPYKDNDRDIFFLSRIASGESVAISQLNVFYDLEVPELHRKMNNLPDGYEQQPGVKGLFKTIEDSNDSFFITGKAGTGKSTFIQYLARKTQKKFLLTAFTGIAAMNVHGQTVHSLFQLPIKPLAIDDHEIKVFGEYAERRKMLERVQMIVVDEVSMLRADVMEAIDASLRKNGGDPLRPFGGKQMIFVGDVFQLPPVTNSQDEAERELFKTDYDSAYFFSSPAYQRLQPKFVELDTAFRQQGDPRFVELLDKVRMCDGDEECLALLNNRYMPDYVPGDNEFVIHLTATNKNAMAENMARLNAISHTACTFGATRLGEFPAEKFPAEMDLTLKRGAQVMFVRNDPQKRWMNGTIGRIEFISSDGIEVRLDNDRVYKVPRERWESRVYTFDRRQRRISTEVTGTFEQFPVRLAWAITVHKSQGLTFDKVIIDMGDGAFVNGQVYTALSRCRTLEGIYLKTPLRQEDLILDPRLHKFYEESRSLALKAG